MTDESPWPSEEAAPSNAEVVVEPQPPSAPKADAPVAAETEPPESPTRGMLRDAIQKVMDQIAHHEKEAEKHLQMAAALRKELRESVAFLRAGGREDKFTELAAASTPTRRTEAKTPEAAPPQAAPGRRRRGRKKKKSAASKGKATNPPC
jgi:hypothetical protein